MTRAAAFICAVPAFPLGQPVDGRPRYGMTPAQADVYRCLVKHKPHNDAFGINFRELAWRMARPARRRADHRVIATPRASSRHNSKVKSTMSILDLSSGGGSYIRFMPSANAWVAGKDEIQLKKVLFDMDSIKTGWCLMAEGQAPQWVWDGAMGRRGLKPESEFKRGFSVQIYLGPQRGWAEWSSNGTGPCMGFEELATGGLASKDENPGKALAANYTGSRPVKVGKGNTRVPLFEIVGWVDRPADADDEDAPPPRSASATPPATGSRAVPPPSKAAAGADMDFG